MITEAIILAGGLGTRLRSVVYDLPKCMATVCGKPFLDYVIEHCKNEGIEKIILSVGYKSEFIKEYYTKNNLGLNIHFSEEEEPLGTGGAVLLAMQKTIAENVLVLNGDTLYRFNLGHLEETHYSHNSTVTLCLQRMQKMERYGTVSIKENRIETFVEKKYVEEGLINAGVYLINKNQFLQNTFPLKFSLEKDFFEAYCASQKMFASVQNKYFIDIGIPEDYTKAQIELSPQKPLKINNNTTLFLDRDGVINEERPNDYVKTWSEFAFYPYTLESLAILSKIFNKIFIVTNQKGIGRKLMTEEDITTVHNNMVEAITKANGRIDKIYYCTALENEAECRKPNAGMAFQAKLDFPEIDLHNSIMVGNKMSDMQFGKNAAMQTILVNTTNPAYILPNQFIDKQFANLLDVALFMQQLV
jgi:D-glycero-alpha-D-manno-heptose 1-phosphate guanylyltransferase